MRHSAVVLLISSIATIGLGTAPAAHAVDRWRNNKGVVYPGAPTGFNGGYSASNTVPVTFVLPASTLTCAPTAVTFSGTVSGTLPAPQGNTGPNPAVAIATLTGGGTGLCTVANVPGFSFTCGAGQLNLGLAPAAYNGGVTTTYGGAAGKVSSGTISGLSCNVRSGVKVCGTIAGSMEITYKNPTTVGGTLDPLNITANPRNDGVLTIVAPNAFNQALAYTSAVPGCAALGANGNVTFGSDATPQLAAPFPMLGNVQPVFWYGAL